MQESHQRLQQEPWLEPKTPNVKVPRAYRCATRAGGDWRFASNKMAHGIVRPLTSEWAVQRQPPGRTASRCSGSLPANIQIWRVWIYQHYVIEPLGHHRPLEPPHPLDVATAVVVPVSEILQTQNHPSPWNISCRRPPIYHLATKSRPRLLLWRGEEISGICNVHISVVFPSNGQQ